MAFYFKEPSHTFSEYLLVPGYSSAQCIPSNVTLKTPVVKYKKGEECPLTMNVPMVSAVMQSVSGEKMGIGLAKEGGIAFIFVSQPIEQQAEMVRKVKNYKAGFVVSDSNLRVTDTLADVLALKERSGHSTMAVTDDGTGTGKLYGNAKAGSDTLELIVSGTDERFTITALFDNLGKGASGAAVQCMNIMMGIDETTGLL